LPNKASCTGLKLHQRNREEPSVGGSSLQFSPQLATIKAVGHNHPCYTVSIQNTISNCHRVQPSPSRKGCDRFMQTKTLGRTGIPVSIVGVGTAFLGMSNLNQQSGSSYEALVANLDEE